MYLGIFLVIANMRLLHSSQYQCFCLLVMLTWLTLRNQMASGRQKSIKQIPPPRNPAKIPTSITPHQNTTNTRITSAPTSPVPPRNAPASPSALSSSLRSPRLQQIHPQRPAFGTPHVACHPQSKWHVRSVHPTNLLLRERYPLGGTVSHPNCPARGP